MYLLDTNVVSEMRKIPVGLADPRVMRWAKSVRTEDNYLSVITVLELEQGALKIERRDRLQGAMLRSWLDDKVLPDFEGRILQVDLRIALRCATLHVPNPRSYRDSLIAATALVHGMTVVTRNLSDFDSTGVALLNPWELT